MARLLHAGLVAQGLLLATSVGAAESARVGQVDGKPLGADAVLRVPAATIQDVVLEGGARILVHGGTEASVHKPNWVPPEVGTKSVRAGRVYLKTGELTVRVPDDGSRPITVASAGGQTALVWRGSARVVTRDGDMRVVVDDGAAYVGAQDKWLRMKSGSAVEMGMKTAPEPYRRRLAPPGTARCAEGALRLVTTGETAPGRVCWQPVDGASAYRVEIAKDAGMSQLVYAADAASGQASAEALLPAGAYHARVLAIGPDGIAGLPSGTMPLRLIRASLSAGGVVAADGVVVLPKGGSVAIDPAGLTVTTAGGDDVRAATRSAYGQTFFSPAPASLGVGSKPARAIRLRDGAGSEVRLDLALRTLRARVEMTPKRVTWPKTPIDVAVTVEDPSGRVDASAANVALEVLVDSKPVNVDWAKESNVHRARIAPVDGPGPFFVRVVARDETGAELGSYVLDVDGTRPLETQLAEREAARDALEPKPLRR